MTWSMFYLACFLIGVSLSVLSFAGGSLHLPHLHLHLPHGVHTGTPHAPAGVGRGADFPIVNFATLTTFLAWFGGTGYLLTRHSTLVVAIVMLIATAIGLAGSAIVFGFIVKLLMPHDVALDSADYDRVGVLGRIVSPIREGGTGEIVFSQEGTRNTCGARSETGEAIARGAEVVVTRYEHGIAYVRRFEDLAADREASIEK
jgi:membrane protein implicated in regulation of membrane protease activity